MAKPEAEILAVYDKLLANLLAGRREEFIAGYKPDVSLVCYGVSGRIDCREEFRLLIESWERDNGFEMYSARSTDRRGQFVGTAAVFTHTLETQFRFDGVTDRKFERETLVFENVDGVWLCAHEHMSICP